MKYVILDLEWNTAYSGRNKQFINEIIEFGAVKTDKDLRVLDTFQMFVRPQVGKRLTGKVKALTNLTQEELSDGVTYLHACKEFTGWLGRDAVLLTWGTGDVLTLIENYRYFAKRSTVPFMKRYLNLQDYIQTRLALPTKNQLGLLSAAELLGVPAREELHRAYEDSVLSLDCLRATYDERELLSFVQLADREFYRKLTFKTMVLSDLENPLVDREKMVFDCEACGQRAVQEGGWALKNKVFCAPFRCKRCGAQFYGKVQFRLKYEGLHVWKKAVKREPAEAREAIK